MRTRLTVAGISLLFALLTLLPYGLAYAGAGSFRFTGFLFNPGDAASYLAKMRQGYEGQILYTLAFTDSPGPGVLFFVYYLALGNLARIFGLSLIAMWHIARVLGIVFFLTVAWEFFGRIGLPPRSRAIAWILVLLGSGFGFLVVPFGSYTADLWVAEYIPFLGMLTNAHFPLAIGLILLLGMAVALPPRRPTLFSLAAVFLLGTALAVIQPFSFVPIGTALVVWIVWTRIERGRFPKGVVAHLAAAGIALLPWVVYDLWITRTVPQFASWFAQNQTPTPPAWDVAVALGLPGLVILAAFLRWIFFRTTVREKFSAVRGATLLLGLWLCINLILLFAPLPLQRRLMLGMWIPLAGLAAPILERLLFRPALVIRYAVYAAIPIVASNLVFLSALQINALGHNPRIFLDTDTAAAVDWLSAHGQGSVVLAPPDLAQWLPGMTGVRVVYGHGMETPNAEQTLQNVEVFYDSTDPDSAAPFLAEHQVKWIVCPAEEPVCSNPATDWSIAFVSDGIKIFAVR
jgi:hypothetical protein